MEDRDNQTQAEEQKRETVTVICNFPAGIVLNNHLGADGKATPTANVGPGGPIEVKGSKEGVDKAFWDAWAANNQDLVNRGVVSAIPTVNENEDRDGHAEEDLGGEGESRPQPDL